MTINGNALSGPAGLTASCAFCGTPGEIESFQSVDRLPMEFGEHKSFYQATVEETESGLQMTLELKPNLPIYRKALGVEWADQLDNKTGEEMLPILTKAVADLETHAADYRTLDGRDWFGYDTVLGFFKRIIPVCNANPKAKTGMRLTIGG